MQQQQQQQQPQPQPQPLTSNPAAPMFNPSAPDFNAHGQLQQAFDNVLRQEPFLSLHPQHQQQKVPSSTNLLGSQKATPITQAPSAAPWQQQLNKLVASANAGATSMPTSTAVPPA